MACSEPENGKSSGGNLEEDRVFHQTAKSNEMNQVTTETVSSFMEATTLHGARFLFSGGYFRRLIWAVALGFCFGYCIYQIFQAVDTFYGKPFNTRITKKVGHMNENLTFLAVSLCNFNSFNRRRYINLMKTRNMSSNDEIKLNLKFIESLLAKSKDVFNSSSKNDHFYLFDRTICEDGSDICYLTLFSHQIDEMLLPSPIFESCDINGTLRLKQLFIIHKLCVWPVLHFQLWTLWLSSNQRYHGRSPKRFEAVVTCGERQLPGFSNKSIRWTYGSGTRSTDLSFYGTVWLCSSTWSSYPLRNKKEKG